MLLSLITAKHSLKKKWNKLKSHKKQSSSICSYEKVTNCNSNGFNDQYNQFDYEEEDDNLANEKLELKIIQIFKLETSNGIPANPDRLFALLEDGSFVPI